MHVSHSGAGKGKNTSDGRRRRTLPSLRKDSSTEGGGVSKVEKSLILSAAENSPSENQNGAEDLECVIFRAFGLLDEGEKHRRDPKVFPYREKTYGSIRKRRKESSIVPYHMSCAPAAERKKRRRKSESSPI